MQNRRTCFSFQPLFPRLFVAICMAGALSGCMRWTALAGVNDAGDQGNGDHNVSSISADGRYLVFSSNSSNLVPNDFNSTTDVFVRDSLTGLTSRASVGVGGINANGASFGGSISGDGRYVAFVSYASNLIPDDSENGVTDVFVYDRQTGTTTLASKSFAGVQGNAASKDTEISTDGRYLVFSSEADNLVFGDNNGGSDIFLYSVEYDIVGRVSIHSDGSEGSSTGSTEPSISANGDIIAFKSWSLSPFGSSPGIFVHYALSGDTELISLAPDAYSLNPRSPTVSPSGSVAYIDILADLDPSAFGNEEIFVWDPMSGLPAQHLPVRQPHIPPIHAISIINSVDFGGCLAFSTSSSQVVEGDTNGFSDVFVVSDDAPSRLSVDAIGIPANGPSSNPVVSDDCNYVGFSTTANNLAPDTTLNTEAVIKAIKQVKVTGITPKTLPRGATTRVLISGENLFDTSRIVLAAEHVTFSKLTPNGPGSIWADAEVDTFTTGGGPRDISVRLQGTGAGPNTGSTWICDNCISELY